MLYYKREESDARWVLVTAPENIAVADLPLGEIEVLQDGRPLSKSVSVSKCHLCWFTIYESGFSRFFSSRDIWFDRVLIGRRNSSTEQGRWFFGRFHDQSSLQRKSPHDISQLDFVGARCDLSVDFDLRDAILHSSRNSMQSGSEPEPMARLLVIIRD